MAQDVGMVRSVVVSFPSSLVGFLVSHPYMRLFSFRKLFCDLFYIYDGLVIRKSSNIAGCVPQETPVSVGTFYSTKTLHLHDVM